MATVNAQLSAISASTHEPGFDGENLIVVKNQMLVQEKSSGNLLYLPLNKQMCSKFGLTLQEELDDQAGSYEGNSELENVLPEENVDNPSISEAKLWNRERTNFLIDLIEQYSSRLDHEVKKYVWEELSKKCTEILGRKITSQQVESKWKSLKRTYKAVLLHNNTSGKQTRYWEFFDKIHNFMHKRPEIKPAATCSSHSGLQVASTSGCQRDSILDTPEDEVQVEEQSAPNKRQMGREAMETSFSLKRRNRESEVSKRHKEKMAKIDRFNDLFEKMVEKM